MPVTSRTDQAVTLPSAGVADDRGAATEQFSDWRVLVDAITADIDEMTDRHIQRLIEEFSSYGGLSPEEVRPRCREGFAVLLELLQDGSPPSSAADNAHHVFFEQIGYLRAQQGVSTGELLQGWRFFVDILTAEGYRRVPESEHRDGLILRLLELATAWCGDIMVSLQSGHRRAQLEMLNAEPERREQITRLVLLGGGTAEEVRSTVGMLGLDLKIPYFAIRARPADESEARRLTDRLLPGASMGRRTGLVAMIDGDLAGFVSGLPAEELGWPVGVSGGVPFDRLVGGFVEATRALDTALATGRTGVCRFSELGLEPAILADRAVGEGLLSRYVTPLGDLGTQGEAILTTVDRFLANSSRRELTARQMNVHVNTVRHRVQKFEETTGCSLQDPNCRAEVWWALRRRTLAAAAA